MLTQIGKSRATPEDGLLPALLACHTRIRGFCDLAARLASDTGASTEEIARAAEMVGRYFSVALPLHAADEDQDLAPALLAPEVAPELADELDSVAREHRLIDQVLADLLPGWSRIADDPGSRGALMPQLVRDTERLRALFEPHLAREEALVFPAITRIPPPHVEGIRTAMRARRAVPASTTSSP